MSEIVEFLLARLAEDERRARECAKVYPGEWDLTDRGWMAKVTADEPFRVVAELNQDQVPRHTVEWLGDALTHVAHWTPARVLAEVEAKRRIVARAETLAEQAAQIYEGRGHTPQAISFAGQAVAWRTALHILALPYADHPDYRPEWRA